MIRSHFRAALRGPFSTPLLTFKSEFILVMIIMALVIIAQTARAESSQQKVRKSTTTTTITTTTSESEGEVESDVEEELDNTGSNDTPAVESEMTAQFGSKAQTGMSGCLIEKKSEEKTKDLMADCKAWLKDQKADLQKRYLSGKCEDSCTDCGMSLRRCNVTGTVRYSKSSAK